MKSFQAAFVATFVFMAATAGQAIAAPVVLDFEELPDPPVLGGVHSYGPEIIENGFKLITGTAFGGFASWPTNSVSYTGSKAIFSNSFGATTTLIQENGGAFSIASMDMTFTSGIINPLAEFNITFNGTTASSALVQQTFTIGPGFMPSMQTLNFSAAFGNIVSLSWTHVDQTYQFDNVNLDNAPALPVPAGLPLLGFGLSCMWLRRRIRP
ncbi:MAG: hypothetical protein KDE14_01105 [Rhodobacteraceae bacterium]|nr:hypothetical protein [Paracoccaceae bacterium]